VSFNQRGWGAGVRVTVRLTVPSTVQISRPRSEPTTKSPGPRTGGCSTGVVGGTAQAKLRSRSPQQSSKLAATVLTACLLVLLVAVMNRDRKILFVWHILKDHYWILSNDLCGQDLIAQHEMHDGTCSRCSVAL